MSWSYDPVSKSWKCTKFGDLRSWEIDNFAEHGQPFSPYEPGFDWNHVPDYSNIVIEIPQSEVMNSGYGRNITASDFPLVHHFLQNGVTMGDTPWMPQWLERGLDKGLAFAGAIPRLPTGSYTLGQLIDSGQAREEDRWISTQLYLFGNYGIDGGDMSWDEAMYVHGSVSFALKKSTVFVVAPKERRVEAEIGAGDDNWDFNSSNVPPVINVAVAAIGGPHHYNLTKPIRILFRGRGKLSAVKVQL